MGNAEDRRESPELTEDELGSQQAEQLPDREAMSVVAPGIFTEPPIPLEPVPGDLQST